MGRLAGGTLADRFEIQIHRWCEGFQMKMHRWSEASVGVRVTTGRQPVVESPCLGFVGSRSDRDKLEREVGGSLSGEAAQFTREEVGKDSEQELEGLRGMGMSFMGKSFMGTQAWQS